MSVRMMKTTGLLAILAVPQSNAGKPSDVVPLLHAQAHNDYRYDPPLLRALHHGLTSVEADVYVVGDKLCVAHDPEEITAKRTLRSLYLEPLRERTKENGGRVYRDGPTVVLQVDIVQRAHAKGRLVRFWATPDQWSAAREALWLELLSAGVDMINTDDLEGLRELLLKHEH